MRIARGWGRLATAIVTIALVAAACGSDGMTNEGAGTPGTTAASDPTFPVTVEHALGQTTIDAEPVRVVALIDRDADTLLSLGITPVAIHSLYGFEGGVGPWAEEALGDETPIVWTGREFNYEAIAAAEPDLIVNATSGGEQEIYDTLAAIAPTIALPKGSTPWAATTQETTKIIAKAVGREVEGEKLLADLAAYLDEQAADHPSFAGKTVNYLDVYPGGISSYPASHIVNSVMYAVGFEPNDATTAIPAGTASVVVSAERLADYDADVLLVYPYGQTLAELHAANPTLLTLESAEHDRLLVLEDLAFSNASVLSLMHALDDLLPKIDRALASAG